MGIFKVLRACFPCGPCRKNKKVASVELPIVQGLTPALEVTSSDEVEVVVMEGRSRDEADAKVAKHRPGDRLTTEGVEWRPIIRFGALGDLSRTDGEVTPTFDTGNLSTLIVGGSGDAAFESGFAHFVERFCRTLGLPKSVQSAATAIALGAMTRSVVPGRHPISVNAAAVYMEIQDGVEEVPTPVGEAQAEEPEAGDLTPEVRLVASKKVTFVSLPDIREFHNSEDEVQYRKFWHVFSLDQARFWDRITTAEEGLGPVFDEAHRRRIFAERIQDTPTPSATTPSSASKKRRRRRPKGPTNKNPPLGFTTEEIKVL